MPPHMSGKLPRWKYCCTFLSFLCNCWAWLRDNTKDWSLYLFICLHILYVEGQAEGGFIPLSSWTRQRRTGAEFRCTYRACGTPSTQTKARRSASTAFWSITRWRRLPPTRYYCQIITVWFSQHNDPSSGLALIGWNYASVCRTRWY